MAKSFNIQGYNYTGYGTEVYGTGASRQQLDEIKATGANAIAIIPEYYQDNLQSNELFTTDITPDDSDVIAGIKAAQARGLNVLLNPHIDTLDGNWRAFLDPSNPDKWFANYKAMEVHYAEIAEQTGVASFSVGCELESMTGANYRSKWLDIIKAVREVYHGELTYASTTTEAATLSFWDKLDVIGVDGYFPLSVKDKAPSVDELKYAWTHPSTSEDLNDQLGGRSIVDYLHDIADKYGKHIQFTEAGFRAIDGAAIDPGDWSRDGAVNEATQADLYKAMFDTFASQGGNWFDGFYMWDWRADETQAEPKDYQTRDRPAQDVVNLWYGLDDKQRAAPDTGMDLPGTVHNDRLVAGVGGTRLLGGDGNDRLMGGDGNDILVGGISDGHAGSRSVITLGAFADMMDGVGAKFKVLVNGYLVGTGEATGGSTESWDIDQFAFSFATPKAFHSVKVVFTNDDGNQAEDRNLYVNTIGINGVTLDLHDAANNQNHHSGTLYANGGFSIDLTGHASDLQPSRSDRDVLDGGYGDDTLTGGVGKDTFGFATGYGRDEITDFGKGDDIYAVNWKGINSLDDVRNHATEHGDDLWIEVGNDTLIVDNFHKSDLREGQFEF